MVSSLSSSPLISLTNTQKPGLISHKYTSGKASWISDATHRSKDAALEGLKLNATYNNPSTKPNSLVCADCDGNGAKECGQCKGTGVNSEDHFDGMFKAGASCWLCRGKREVLCGSCNGAGFIGGFMNALED